MSPPDLRAIFGKGEHIAVVGPRLSGVSTLVALLEEWHRAQGRTVLVHRLRIREPNEGRIGLKPDVTLYDGFIPVPTPAVLRVITASAII